MCSKYKGESEGESEGETKIHQEVLTPGKAGRSAQMG
jgi:hypothetical protein